MRSNVFILAVVLAVTAVSVSKAVPVEWSSHPDGKVHYYDVVENTNMSWYDAKAEAESDSLMFNGMHGYLATITSAAENSFIYDTFLAADKNPQSYYYWIGGFQSPFPGGDWQWVTDEPWSYTNWSPTEPSGDGEATHIYSCLSQSFVRGKWNDEAGTTARDEYGSYVVEYVPEPCTLLLLGLGGLAIRLRSRQAVMLRRKHRAKYL